MREHSRKAGKLLAFLEEKLPKWAIYFLQELFAFYIPYKHALLIMKTLNAIPRFFPPCACVHCHDKNTVIFISLLSEILPVLD